MPKITMIGAGSMVFAKNLIGDILSYPELDGSVISLMDIDPARLEMSASLARQMVAQQRSRCRIEATLDRREALAGANYVIIAIQVGGLDAYEQDIEIPRRYGVEQCVGDTLNPGGIFRGLRTIPVLQSICRDMEELCPDALMLQYSNPMCINMWAIAESSPIRAVGLCHSVQGTSEMLARFIGAPYNEVSFRCAGINHMAWFTEFSWNGEDAYPLIHKAADDPVIYGSEPVRFDMLRHLGYFVTESSGHASEYNPWFRKRPDLLEQTIATFTQPNYHWVNWGRTGGYLNHCKKRLDEFGGKLERWLSGAEAIPISRSHEYGIQIIHSMETNTLRLVHGNVPNTGLITNLPQGCCVEVPTLVDKTGLRPTYIGALPPQLAALNRTNTNVQELAVQGSLRGDRDLIRHALMMDPLTAAVCSLDQIEAMTKELFAAHQQWLPQFA